MLPIHRLVAAAFIGPCPDGQQVHHIDADRANNTRHNLAYVTATENSRHAARMRSTANNSIITMRQNAIDSNLHRQAKVAAAEKGITLRAWMDEAVAMALGKEA